MTNHWGQVPGFILGARLLNSYLLVVFLLVEPESRYPFALRLRFLLETQRGHKTDLLELKEEKNEMMVARVGGREFPNALQGSAAVS